MHLFKNEGSFYELFKKHTDDADYHDLRRFIEAIR